MASGSAASEGIEDGLAEVSRRIRRREISPVEVVEATLQRIERRNPELGALLAITAERALSGARAAEREISRGNWRGPLHGIPFTVKDLFDAAGTRTTAASRFLQDAPLSTMDSAVVARLERAGAVLVGKANLHEFAFGTTSVSSAYGPVRNPRDPSRIAGGSSGGSAAAVAAGLGLASIGTDTGGSIRIPAALCGVVGLKPTFGRVSRAGLLPLAPSLDHVGPLARTVEDVALVLEAIAGEDPADPSSARQPVPDCSKGLGEDLRGLRIGAVHPGPSEANQDAKAAFQAALVVLREAGAELHDVALPSQRETREAAYTILFVESADTHRERLAERPELFFPDVRERFERGHAIAATDYLHALRVRERNRERIQEVLRRVDVLVSPMLPIAAPPIGVETVVVGGEELPVPVVATTHTREWNALGHPALSVPAGLDPDGLPLAIQLIAGWWQEPTVLRVGHAFQLRTRWHVTKFRVD